MNFKYLYFCWYGKSIIHKDWPEFSFLYNRLIWNSNCPSKSLLQQWQICQFWCFFSTSLWLTGKHSLIIAFFPAVQLWAQTGHRKNRMCSSFKKWKKNFSIFFHFSRLYKLLFLYKLSQLTVSKYIYLYIKIFFCFI